MKSLQVLVVSLIAVLASRSATASELPTAKPHEVGLDADKIQMAHDAVQALVDKKEMAGARRCRCSQGQGSRCSRAFGESEAGSGKAMKTDAIVRIYSMTKPITTVAAMILVEEGKIGLDDPLSKYDPRVQGPARSHQQLGRRDRAGEARDHDPRLNACTHPA